MLNNTEKVWRMIREQFPEKSEQEVEEIVRELYELVEIILTIYETHKQKKNPVRQLADRGSDRKGYATQSQKMTGPLARLLMAFTIFGCRLSGTGRTFTYVLLPYRYVSETLNPGISTKGTSSLLCA